MRVYRSRHREVEDAAAHEEAHEPTPVLEHDLVPQGEPELVATEEGLAAALAHVREAGVVGYDTEFIGETTFYPRICVIQLGTADRIYLIDGLAEIDLTPFWELLADAGVVKIVHAGRQDLEPVLRLLGRPALSVYDVQIAAGFCGHGYPLSLGKLVLAVGGADVGKSVKFSQWDRRPLTAAQQSYAANDVRYLPMVYERLRERIASLGHTEKVAAEMKDLEDPAKYRLDPLSGRLRGAGAGKLNRRGRTVLEALLVRRFSLAEQTDLPPRSLMADDVLVRIADEQPGTVEALGRIKGMPRPVARDHGEAILEALKEGMAAKITHRPGRPKVNPDRHKRRVDGVWSKLEALCEEVSIDPALVISKRELSTLLLPVADRKERRAVEPSGWRGEMLAGCWPADRER
ncbi:ribonuclease D [Mucisphaera sp.]|uniref:ribonuclease D n=1 Tax=Mucisphaera sp. TaxID=2913024 RepID=UPI003D0DBDCA